MGMEGDVVIGARLAEKFGVAPPTVTETLKRMVRDGYIEMDSRRQVTLTPKGVAHAEGCLRRHRLTERFLVDMLGMQWHQVHEEAAGWSTISPARSRRGWSPRSTAHDLPAWQPDSWLCRRCAATI